MRRFLIAFGVVGACALVALIFYVIYRHETGPVVPSGLSDFPGYKAEAIVIDGQSIQSAIADTPDLQSLGLGNRDGLPQGEGMIFIFPVDKEYAFWMKDMRFSIDMIWISADDRIVYMAQDVAPDTYPHDFIPTIPARYVLELPANYALQHGFKIGDTVQM